jgi:AcrR family transcriptional regulator
LNERKKQVIKFAHQLFIEKGYLSTSIQDIIEFSGISKGTFYNYFSSKSELLLAVFKMIYKRWEKERNELLIGQDPADKEVFIKQLELHMRINKENKLLSLLEDGIVSNDVDIKEYIQHYRITHLKWVYLRFLDLFGEDKKVYLLDCAVIFSGILHNMISHNYMKKNEKNRKPIMSIIRFCINRITPLVEEIAQNDEKVFSPEDLNIWLPGDEKNEKSLINKFIPSIISVKKSIHLQIKEEKEREKYFEYLDFIEEEILQTRLPRRFLIESAFRSLKDTKIPQMKQEILLLEQLTEDYLKEIQ